MKAGRYGVQAAPPGTRPDLTGLSCRWNPIEARHGEIVSIIAVPAPGRDPGAFRRLVTKVLAMLGSEERDGHPLAAEGPTVDVTFTGLEREVSATAASGHRFSRKLAIIGQILALWVLARTGITFRGFTADGYRRDVAENSDFRKFDDGLKMTVDLDAARSAAIEAVLREAETAGICRYGIHRQSSALMTCIVASPLKRNHIHFIDGAAGGYAMAAANLKAKAA
jgi:hypothetical protein